MTWIHNEITIEGPLSHIRELLGKAESEKTKFSLQNFIPCPAELLNVTTPPVDVSNWQNAALFPWVISANNNKIPKTKEEFLRVIARFPQFSHLDRLNENMINYGFSSSYEWCTANWGTPFDLEVSQISKVRSRRTTHKFSVLTHLSAPNIALQRLSSEYESCLFSNRFTDARSSIGTNFLVFANGIRR